jgi:hypothetical protein
MSQRTHVGGLASDAIKLIQAIDEKGQNWSVGTWTRARIERQLLGVVAAVQRGKALAMLAGYTRASSAQAGRTRRRAEMEAESEEGRDGEDVEEQE